MSREVRRVPLDFNWPLKKVWGGYLMPKELHLPKCPTCGGSGSSPAYENLHALWYGNIPFDPATTGSTLLQWDTPAVRAFAERNLANAPEYYGTGEAALQREGQRLADLWNGMWCHHITQDDVDALVAAGRLMDLTHTWSRETRWQPKDPPYVPTAAEVNEWSLLGFGHDSINCWVVVRARCEREGLAADCAGCGGSGNCATPEQQAAYDAWKSTEPPTGEGWQLWETVSEGSPVSPVFPTDEALAEWMADPERGRHWMPQEAAAKFIKAGWAPSFVGTPETGLVSGVEYVGWHADSESEV